MTEKMGKMENRVLEIDPEIEATLQPQECPVCGFENNVIVSETHRYAADGVMNGVRYQVVEVTTTVCQQCGTAFLSKKYL
ncbi:MAG: hypothetical protein LBI18_08275 [Planctomycetaceae bacterium]|nr:hypothetical protein [Planctomycetaceae bacterium]